MSESDIRKVYDAGYVDGRNGKEYDPLANFTVIITCDMSVQLEARNAELLEAVKKAHEILLHEMDNGRTPSMLQGVGLGYFEDVIAGLDDVQFRRG